jgi:hypothetical protein
MNLSHLHQDAMARYEQAQESYSAATQRVTACRAARLPISERDVAAERHARAQLALARDLAMRLERLRRSARSRTTAGIDRE